MSHKLKLLSLNVRGLRNAIFSYLKSQLSYDLLPSRDIFFNRGRNSMGCRMGWHFFSLAAWLFAPEGRLRSFKSTFYISFVTLRVGLRKKAFNC